VIILNQLQKRFSPSFAKIARKGSERPTRYIYLLIFIFVALFMQAYIHNYNIVYMTLFFTFGFAMSSYPFGRNNIRALELELFSFERVFAHEKSLYALRLHSAKQELYDITCIAPQDRVHIDKIKEGEARLITLSHTYAKRGEQVLESVECVSGFPLPHQTFYKVFDINRRFVVYPEPKGESLDTFMAKSRMLYGEREDFDGIRNFESGDRLSEIYWPSLAKGDALMSKHFLYSDESRELVFEFEQCGRDDESRLSQLTLWVLECEKRDLNFTVVIAERRLEREKMETDEILSFLGRF